VTAPVNPDRAGDESVTVSMSKLLSIYLSGYGSGIATAIANIAQSEDSGTDLVEWAGLFARRECVKSERDPVIIDEIMRVIRGIVTDTPTGQGIRALKTVIQ